MINYIKSFYGGSPSVILFNIYFFFVNTPSFMIKALKKSCPNSKFLFHFFVTEIEGQPTSLKNLPWGPLYCVLQQDEQAFTAYCSEELSVSSTFLIYF